MLFNNDQEFDDPQLEDKKKGRRSKMAVRTDYIRMSIVLQTKYLEQIKQISIIDKKNILKIMDEVLDFYLSKKIVGKRVIKK